jgi:hypothetical protein
LGPSITIIVHSLEFAGTKIFPGSGFNFFGGADYFGIILPEIKSTYKLFILPYATSTIVKGINELRICTMKGQGFILL